MRMEQTHMDHISLQTNNKRAKNWARNHRREVTGSSHYQVRVNCDMSHYHVRVKCDYLPIIASLQQGKVQLCEERGFTT